ncbi:MAG: segregation/condensation protein A [Planctomycetaceae bacterium]|nr:MAG: segregation/condensation protein A [Planctomycetaceae bacterium]
MVTTIKHVVHIDDYHGPLDLLLYLVRRNELDVTALSLATITEQFLEFLQMLQFLDFEITSEFIMTASSLLELKSQSILPLPDEDDASADQVLVDQAEPAQTLILRLLEYKRYRELADELQECAVTWQQRYPRLYHERPVWEKDYAADPIREVELWDLVSALGRVLHQKALEQTASIRYEEIPLAYYQDRIASLVRQQERVAFSSLFEGTKDRRQIIAIFLAILELLRRHGFRAEQYELWGEIYIMPPLVEMNSLAEVNSSDQV